MNTVLERWPAPAKLNLFLHITAQRKDGYHELQTVFQFLDFCDQLTFEVGKAPIISRQAALPGVAEQDDICVKAATLLQREMAVPQGVCIGIEKQIPMGGGLGGGSSDAATTLLALNRLWNLGLSTDKLAEIGLKLGADVPVFVRGYAAWAEGVGDKLEKVEQLPEPWYVVIAPPVHVCTEAIFNSPDLTRNCPPITIRHLKAGECANVCEPVVRKLFPEVDKALKWLVQHGSSQMTGTGACVFSRFETQAKADKILSLFRDSEMGHWQAFVARGLNRSPLMAMLESA